MKKTTTTERRLEIQFCEIENWRVPIRVKARRQAADWRARLRNAIPSIEPGPVSLRAIGWRVPASGRRIRFARFLAIHQMKASSALSHA
jgi:hypothetical protein